MLAKGESGSAPDGQATQFTLHTLCQLINFQYIFKTSQRKDIFILRNVCMKSNFLFLHALYFYRIHFPIEKLNRSLGQAWYK